MEEKKITNNAQIPESTDPIESTPFDEVVAEKDSEKKKKKKYGAYERLIGDKFYRSSKREKMTAIGILVGSGLIAFYLLFCMFVKMSLAMSPYRLQVDYSPLHFFELVTGRYANASIFLSSVALAVMIGLGLCMAYLRALDRKENNGVIRSKLGTHGTANWINNEPGELEMTFERHDEDEDPGYVIIGRYRGWTYSVCQDPKHYQVKNFNICGIGASGTGKTFGLFGPMILCRIAYGESFVATDTKGDLFRNFAHVCEEFGYDVKVFNTTSWKHSDSWNCLEDIVYASEEEVQNYINIYTNVFMNNTTSLKEDFWAKQEAELFRACLNLVTRDSSYEGKRTLAELILLINSKESEIREKMELADPKVKRAIQSVLSWDNAKVREDVRSGLSGRLSIFRTEVVAEAMSIDGINFKDAVSKPTAIFVITKDSDSTYDSVTSLFVTVMYMKLVEISNSREYQGKLFKPFWFIMDEMCNMAAIKDLDKKVATNRSRRINFCLCIQSKSQMDQKYPRLADNILSNCGIITFLGSDDDDSVKYVVNRCGTFTQVEVSTVKDVPLWDKVYVPLWRRKNTKLSPKKLLEYDEASKFKSGQVIQLIQGKSPFKGETFPQTMHPLWKYVVPTEPEDRVQPWYEDFCEKFPEYKNNEGIEYIPSAYERSGNSGPRNAPPAKVSKDNTDQEIRNMLGINKPSAPAPISEEKVKAIEESRRRIKEAEEKLAEPKNASTERPAPVPWADTSEETPEPTPSHYEEPVSQDDDTQYQDYSDVDSHHENMVEADSIGGDHTEADFNPTNDDDDSIEALFM